MNSIEAVAEPESYSARKIVNVGVVAIGRNEGDRLRKCLESIRGLARMTAPLN